MDGTETKYNYNRRRSSMFTTIDEKSSIMAGSQSRVSIYIDYVEFWRTIEETQEIGHRKLRKLLEERKIHIGDSIPNKEFWLQIKDKLNSNHQNKSNQPPTYTKSFKKGEPGDYTKMVELNLKNEKNDKLGGSTEELADSTEADVDLNGIFRRTYTTGSVKYCQNKMRLVHSLSKKRPNQKANEMVENKDETGGYKRMKDSINKKQLNESVKETNETTDEPDGYMRLKEESGSFNECATVKDKLELDEVPEGHLYRLGKKIEGEQNETVFRIILDNVFNGHELILHVLDCLVSKTYVNECSDCFGYTKKDKIEVDLGPLFKRKYEGQENLKHCRNKMRLIHDLIEIQNERGDDENIKKIFKHPIFEILILKKWEEKQNWYFHSVRLFMLFVLLFTFFVRLRILESNTPKLSKSDVDDNFIDKIINKQNITFSTNMIKNLDLDMKEQIADWSKKGMQFLDANGRSHDFIYRIIEIYDNGTSFTAMSLGETPSFFKVFYNKMSNVILFSLVMFCLIMSQILFVFIYFIEQFTSNCEEDTEKTTKHSDTAAVRLPTPLRLTTSAGSNGETVRLKKEDFQKRKAHRRQRNVAMHRWNVVYLVIGTFLCFILHFDEGICLKIALMLICTWLLILEIRQLAVLVFSPASKGCNYSMAKFFKQVRQKRYWKDPENYLEMVFLISVPVSIFYQGWELTQPRTDLNRNSDLWNRRTLCRGFVAMGVFSAWIELVIKMGNISLSVVGDFIKMFYNIIKDKLLSYMLVCLLLISAFTLSFWVILEGQLDTEIEPNFSTGFWFSQTLTTTMSTGEFNTAEFYRSIKGNAFTKVFALILLAVLICLSTITMINLLVAAIISDYNAMKEEVDEENLCFIAEYIIEVEKYQRRAENSLPTAIFNFIYPSALINREDFKIKEDYCPHLICNDCSMEPLPIPRPGTARFNPAKEANQRKPLLLRLLEICGTNENLCAYHLKKWGKEMQENKENNTLG